MTRPDPDHKLLGISDHEYLTESVDETRLACAELAGQARHQLRLFSHRLASELFDQAAFIEALRQLATERPRSRIRLLFSESDALTSSGHRLPRLAQRLPSRLQLQRVDEEYRDEADNFLLADEAGCLYLADWRDNARARVNFNDRLRARELGERFETLWEHSHPDPALRRLPL